MLSALKTYSNRDVEMHYGRGYGKLYEHYYHPTSGTKNIAKNAAYPVVVMIDDGNGINDPEHHFEGVLQISQKVKERGGQAVLVPETFDRDRQGDVDAVELAYRVGRGTGSIVAPTHAFRYGQECQEIRIYCTAAAILAAVGINTGDPLVAAAVKVFQEQDSISHFSGPFTNQGRVHLKPYAMPPPRTPMCTFSGTSTEAGMHGHFEQFRKHADFPFKDLSNRRIGSRTIDTNTAGSLLHYGGSHDLIFSVARGWTAQFSDLHKAADRSGGHRRRFQTDQFYVQPMIYSKRELFGMPPDYAKRHKNYGGRKYAMGNLVHIATGNSLSGYYQSARQRNLSYIPLQETLLRIYDVLREEDSDDADRFEFSNDGVHMTGDYLYMAAGLTYTSRTGLDPPPMTSSTANKYIGMGAKLVRQMAHLTASGEPTDPSEC